MIYLLSFTTFTYKNNYFLKSNQTNYEVSEEFGFQKGGIYDIQLMSNGNDQFFIFIDTTAEIAKYLKDKGSEIFSCNKSKNVINHNIIQIQNGTGRIMGTVEKHGHYQAFFQSCSQIHQDCQIRLIFKNPNSCLSIEDQHCMKMFSFLAKVSFIGLILWLINWLYYFTLKNSIHSIFSLFLLLSFINNFCIYKYFYERNKSDDVNNDTKYLIYFKFMRELIYLCTIAPILYVMDTNNESIMLFHFINFIFNVFISNFISKFDFNMLFQKNHDEIFQIFIDKNRMDLNTFNFICFILFIYWIINLISMFRYNDENRKTNYNLFVNILILINEYTSYLVRFFIIIFTCSNRNVLLYSYFIDLTFNILLVYLLRLRKGVVNDYRNLNRKVFFFDFSKNNKIPKQQFEYDSIDNIEIPSHIIEIGYAKLEIIGQYCFAVTNIKNIVIPSGVKKIEKGVFYHCKKLQSIDFHDDSELTTIDEKAFLNSSINKLTIPAKVARMNEGWCQNTSYLNIIKLSKDNLHFSYLDESFIIGKGIEREILFFARRNIKKATIPGFIKKIESHAFECCKQLHEVKIPNHNNLKVINNFAFCKSLIGHITITKSVIKIGQSAFCDCTNLRSVEFAMNSNLSIIDCSAFQETHIEHIMIPSKVQIICKKAFYRCQYLKSIKFEYKSELKIIEDEAFEWTSIESICFPSEIMKIGKCVFNLCKNIQIVEIPRNLSFSISDFGFISRYPNIIMMVHR